MKEDGFAGIPPRPRVEMGGTPPSSVRCDAFTQVVMRVEPWWQARPADLLLRAAAIGGGLGLGMSAVLLLSHLALLARRWTGL